MNTRVVLFALAITCAPACSQAAQYFVSSTGSDTAAGSNAAPWKTLQQAANIVGPGDRVTVRTGSYVGFDLTRSGTAAAPIEFDADPGVLINQRNATTPDGINLEDASHVIIDGFTVNGMPRAGIRTVGVDGDELASFVTIRNVTATNNQEWGIFTGFVDDLLIEKNVTSGSIDQHGIYVSNSGDRPVIRNNISFNNHDNGIHMNGDASQGGDGIISGALVTGNIIYNNGTGGGSGINMDGVQNSRIENNLIYGNHASGISLYQIDGGGSSKNNVVVNNTIYEANDARWALNIQDGSTGNTLLNNIMLSAHPTHGAIDISADSLPGFTSDYNAVISRFTTDDGDTVKTLAQWQTATGQDAHSFVATAANLFANAAGNAYHLEGLPRKAGAAFDIGAYEFGALAGDYDRDGAVTAADYILWRKTLGSTVTRYAGADGDGSGIIDQADYLRWRANFATAAAAGTALTTSIPEPPSIATICFAFAILQLTSVRFQLR